MSDGAGHVAGGHAPELASLIDAYLDGAMSAAEVQEFEARLRTDAEAARELELQRRADDSIRRQFEPPAVSSPGVFMPTAAGHKGVVANIGPGAGEPRRRLLSRPLAAAAAIAIAAVGGYWAINGSPLGSQPEGMVSPQVVYHRVVDGGFKPEWVCEDDQQFATYTKDRFGAAWKVMPEEGLKLVGWRYSHDLLGPDASLLLAEKGGKQIVIAVDEASHDRRLRDGEGLHVFRRKLGNIVLYEISPLDKPAVVERIAIE